MKPRESRIRTPIAVFPSLVTLGNLICGFAAVGVAAQVHWRAIEPDPMRSFGYAGLFILFAMVFDAFDGRIARMTNQTSAFGAELDSLCDMVSFGIAPAALVLLEAAGRPGSLLPVRIAWVCAALYAVCAAMRLARFNVETAPSEEAHRYFRGLPSPAAAGVIASLAIFNWRTQEEALWTARFMPFAAILLGGLMISRFRYVHLLNRLFSDRKPFTYLGVIIFLACTFIALLFQHFEYILLVGFVAYMCSGPVTSLWRVIHPRRSAAQRLPADARTRSRTPQKLPPDAGAPPPGEHPAP